MDNLKTTPFTIDESNKSYKRVDFVEDNINISFLNETRVSRKIPSGNLYKFGVIIEGKYYWYFNGNIVADSRDKMRTIFKAILGVSEVGQSPFVLKSRR